MCASRLARQRRVPRRFRKWRGTNGACICRLEAIAGTLTRARFLLLKCTLVTYTHCAMAIFSLSVPIHTSIQRHSLPHSLMHRHSHVTDHKMTCPLPHPLRYPCCIRTQRRYTQRPEHEHHSPTTYRHTHRHQTRPCRVPNHTDIGAASLQSADACPLRALLHCCCC